MKFDGVNELAGHVHAETDGVNDLAGHVHVKSDGVNELASHVHVETDGVNDLAGHVDDLRDRVNAESARMNDLAGHVSTGRDRVNGLADGIRADETSALLSGLRDPDHQFTKSEQRESSTGGRGLPSHRLKELDMKTAIASLLLAATLGATGCATRAVIVAGPPPARVEFIPVRPYYGAVWIPGHWVARYSGWVWVRGYWR